MKATKLHCFLCFEALENHINKTKKDTIKKYFESQNISEKFPLFVTWTKNRALRGCIGCFRQLPLVEGLCNYAVIAGTEDPRFNEIKSSELKNLEVDVSLLHSFEECSDPFDWTIGKHGLIFNADGYESTFLPIVMEENKWTKEETLNHLSVKAGYKRNLTQSDYKRIKMKRYQSSYIGATWKEYQDYLISLN